MLITTGSGQGIDMISRMFVDPGDTVILEEFCYAGAINRFKRVGANIVGMPLDEDGMRMDVLASTLEELKQKGVTPKYIYTIPTIQNPSGSILPLERRQQMLTLARQYGVPIFEDECYADLIWAGGAPPSLYSMDPKQVVHIGSFSKTLAPGAARRLRGVGVAGAVAHDRLQDRQRHRRARSDDRRRILLASTSTSMSAR